ncbi:helix-turn-helix domain-containing protein [Sphaerisporangium aureirubrum]|uniref:Helix-turn-helix domain-containing protein n=1 Tax=Sphaerisporangium aureirubrum TaxID=1544736 RepID=A0ABW1NST5_9ACTN
MTSVQLRRLSRELVRLRTEAGKTGAEVTKAMGWSAGRLGYYEQGKWQRADIGNVARLLTYYGVTDPEREALLDLARQSRIKGWWASYKDIFPTSLAGFENAATLIRTCETSVVPGLLQTLDYTVALLQRGVLPADESVIQRKAEGRRARQKILERENPPDLWAVIDEAALLRLVGGADVMRAQLRHLVEMAAWPRITIQVLPLVAGAHPGVDGGFEILDFASPEDTPLVHVEGAVNSLFMENPGDVQRYTLIFSHVISAALTPDESISHMAELQDRLEKGRGT